jgi:RNA polymerase sigma-70 factor (ECF subfamily)
MGESTLDRAKAGDNDAFEALIGPYRHELQVHCYRILGSVQDAEDVLQETLLAAWQAIDGFDGRSLRAWLYRIATNRCRNYLRDASRRPIGATMPEPASPFTNAQPSDEPWWLEPYPDALLGDVSVRPDARYDARESIALSFVAGLQRLPTQQRIALVPAAKPAANVVARFVDAFQRGDLDAVVELLADDAKVTMPPEPYEFHGRAAITDFYRTQGLWNQQIKLVPTSANHQPAFGYYLRDPHANVHRAGGILVLSITGVQISAITRFGDRSLLSRFGLPRTLPTT